MICLWVFESQLNVALIIFYTCVLMPLRQLKEDLLSIFGLLMLSSLCDNQEEQQPILVLEPFLVDLTSLEFEGMVSSHHQKLEDLPIAVVRFGEMDARRGGRVEDDGEEEVCSVCLVEFKREDEVSQLSRCQHVFHLSCIGSWIDRNRFTCPLCRSSLLDIHDATLF